MGDDPNRIRQPASPDPVLEDDTVRREPEVVEMGAGAGCSSPKPLTPDSP